MILFEKNPDLFGVPENEIFVWFENNTDELFGSRILRTRRAGDGACTRSDSTITPVEPELQFFGGSCAASAIFIVSWRDHLSFIKGLNCLEWYVSDLLLLLCIEKVCFV